MKATSRKKRGREWRFLTESLVHHRLLLLLLALFIQQRTEGVSDKDREINCIYVSVTKRQTVKENNPDMTSPPHLPYLWLLADGRHRNMMTNRMMENKKRQNASSIHSSLQSCRRTDTETVLMKTLQKHSNIFIYRKRMKVVLRGAESVPDRIQRIKQNTQLKMYK